jgi:hypothetical protein
MLIAYVSFFNELSTEKKNTLIYFVSFFNEFATETQKLSSQLLLDHGFQEDNDLEGHHVKGQN